MSDYRRCDICDSKEFAPWKYRKRFKLFQTHCHPEGCWDDELDMCDECMKGFKEFIHATIAS